MIPVARRVYRNTRQVWSGILIKLHRDQTALEMELRSLDERPRFDVEAHRKFLRAQLVEDLRPIVQAVAKAKKADLVMPVDGQNDASYINPAVDLTEEVVRRFDAGAQG